MSVEFIDNSAEVEGALEEAVIKWLYESGSTLSRQAANNTRSGKGQTAGAWDYTVDEHAKECHVGNPLENAIWDEFGTGEYALKGNGRKGYWVYVKGSDGGSEHTGKSYTLAEAKQVMAILRSQGLDAYYTKGRKPIRALHNARVIKEKTIQNRLVYLLNKHLK